MPYSPFGLAHLAEDRPHLSAGPLRYWVTDTAGQAIAHFFIDNQRPRSSRSRNQRPTEWSVDGG
jgi:hypothetical protein